MARKREVILEEEEDIVSMEHHMGANYVRALVGYGSRDANGNFTPSDAQVYENYLIQGDAYNELLAAKGPKPAGVFRKDDLWEPIDKHRNEIMATRERERKILAEREAAVKNLRAIGTEPQGSTPVAAAGSTDKAK